MQTYGHLDQRLCSLSMFLVFHYFWGLIIPFCLFAMLSIWTLLILASLLSISPSCNSVIWSFGQCYATFGCLDPLLVDVIHLSVCKLVLRESFLCLVFVLFAFIYIPFDNVDCLISLLISHKLAFNLHCLTNNATSQNII